MINVIFTYKATVDLPTELQLLINQVQFVEIPEMKRTEEVIGDDITLVSIPYQATVSESIFNSLSASLSNFGDLEIIGKWDENGEIIEFDLHKYRDALKDIKVFEEVVLINGEDFTGREEDFVPNQQKDKDGNLLELNGMPLYEEVTVQRISKCKSSKSPTLTQAKQIHVNVFNSNFKRKLE